MHNVTAADVERISDHWSPIWMYEQTHVVRGWINRFLQQVKGDQLNLSKYTTLAVLGFKPTTFWSQGQLYITSPPAAPMLCKEFKTILMLEFFPHNVVVMQCVIVWLIWSFTSHEVGSWSARFFACYSLNGDTLQISHIGHAPSRNHPLIQILENFGKTVVELAWRDTDL